jgi:septum formation protein
MEKLPFRLTLASGSQGRRWLLTKAGYTFDVCPADVDEPTAARYGSCRQYVQETAWLKAAAVAASGKVADGFLLAADTVGWIDHEVIGKPADRAEAFKIIRQLAGREHELWTGVCLWRLSDGMQFQYQELTTVFMKQLNDQEIEAYLDTRRWEGCSGAYAIAEYDDPYLKVVQGSWSNVVGLPLESLAETLKMLAK